MIRIRFVTDFLGVNVDDKKWDSWGKLKVFVFSDILGVKIDAKKRDELLHTQCVTFELPEKSDIARPGGRPTGGKMHVLRIDLIIDFLWVKVDAKKWNSWGKLKVVVFGSFGG